jgi:5,10-methylene-tetrahydrofolate dehydrogenase/methenyl tetrahydrofolate cyclohydrolase
MTAQIIDGKLIAQQVRDEVAAKVAQRVAAGKQKPTLATVLVGDRPDSAAYVASKGKACQELGMGSISEHLPADASQEQVESLVKSLNADPKVSGILVQLPMPAHIDEERVLSLINIEKDVDGFSPINIGRLAQKGREPLFVPCTPYGCIYLLEKSGVQIEGANAVVLGRSNIVGMPVALLLIGKNATVTVCHSRTKNLASVVRQADILQDANGARRLGQARRGRHRCGHQFCARCDQEERTPPGRRCLFRGSEGGCRLHHPGPGRRGAHDDRDAHEEHPARRRNPGSIENRPSRHVAGRFYKLQAAFYRSLPVTCFRPDRTV